MHPTANDVANNSFDSDLPPVERDFQSLDETQLTRPRKSSGQLPTITFLRPKLDDNRGALRPQM
ncbi:MAG: DUF4990 domain-containing protein [Fuerstiella sp.]